MANEKTPVVWDDTTNKHRPLGTGEKMGGLDASSLLSSDSGNLLEAGSDGLAYLSGSGMVDPRADNLLEESDRGKLQVTVDRIAEWLDGHPQDAAALADAMNVVSGDEGNLIVQGSDKGAFLSNAELAAAFAGLSDAEKQAIAAAVAEKMAAQLADGKTIVASGGKLTSDPTNATVAQKKAINQALADADSGLVVDNSTGKLKVDFSNMPTDKFEELLKSLDMQVPLEADLAMIVDGASGGDSIVDGRGTEAKPWKTIQACVTYVTSTYSLNTHTVTVRVKPGTYVERVVLPRFDATTGYITIQAYSGSRDVVVESPVDANGVPTGCFSASGGGHWVLRNIHMVLNVVPTTLPGYTARGLLSSSSGSRVDLYGCHFDQRAAAGSISGGTLDVRVVTSDSEGVIWLMHNSALPHQFSFSNVTEHLNVYVLDARRSSTIVFPKSSSPDTVACTGACTLFALISDGSNFHSFTVGSLFNFSGASVTGKRYSVTEGSYCNLGGGANFFPGDVAGTVDNGEDGRPQTYCWYN